MPAPKRKVERRKANLATAVERRGNIGERRKCPECGSELKTAVDTVVGGTITRTFCTKCLWRESNRQVDMEHIRLTLGYEVQISGSDKNPVLELDPDILKAAGWELRDTIEIKPLYTPGAGRSLTFVLKKIE